MVPAPVVEMESKMQTLTGMVIVEVIEGRIFLIALGLGWFCLAVSYERRLLRARLELEAINGAAGWEAVVGKHWLDEIKTSPGDDWISRAAIATGTRGRATRPNPIATRLLRVSHRCVRNMALARDPLRPASLPGSRRN